MADRVIIHLFKNLGFVSADGAQPTFHSNPGCPDLTCLPALPLPLASGMQPMKLSHFPFDSWDLLVQLELQDTAGPGHPGLRLVPSSAGTTLVA